MNLDFDGTTDDNLHIKDIIVNESKDQYLLTKLKSNVVGNIAVVATKYPSSRNKYPIPNSDVLIYSKGNVTKFNFNGIYSQYTEFIKYYKRR